MTLKSQASKKMLVGKVRNVLANDSLLIKIKKLNFPFMYICANQQRYANILPGLIQVHAYLRAPSDKYNLLQSAAQPSEWMHIYIRSIIIIMYIAMSNNSMHI